MILRYSGQSAILGVRYRQVLLYLIPSNDVHILFSSPSDLYNIILYDDSKFDDEKNTTILRSTIKFIKISSRVNNLEAYPIQLNLKPDNLYAPLSELLLVLAVCIFHVASNQIRKILYVHIFS